MKRESHDKAQAPARQPAAACAGASTAAQAVMDGSPTLLAQRRQLEKAFGEAAQPAEQAPVNRTGMPDGLKSGIESLSGMDMSDVRVHTNSAQPRQINALAYAQGNDIHLGPGQEKHLPHEAWHLVQQRQGRVRPTTEVQGQAVNDDPGLEREADVMGARAASSARPVQRALQGPATGSDRQPPTQRRSTGAGVVQAIMSVAEFQAATPGSVFKPRATIVNVDAALNTYVTTRTAANANTLIGVIQGYVNGDHDANRKQIANGLLQRATAEHQLLQQIGDDKAFLVDALIEQAGMGRIAQLVQLATDVTGGHALILPTLIDAIGGGANINNLNTSGLVAHITAAHAGRLVQLIPLAGGMAHRVALDALVQAAGAAHAPLLEPMLTQAGGATQLVNLTTIVNRHAGQGDLAFDLTREAGGNAATFARLAAEVPAFQQAAAPGVLPNVAAAIANYNNAIPPALAAEMAQVVAQATTAHAQAVALGGPAGLLPNTVAAGLLGNLLVRIGNLNVRAVAVGGGAARAAGDLVLVTQVGNLVANAVSAQVANAVAAAPQPITPALHAANVAFANAAAAVATAAAKAHASYDPPTIANVNVDHFLTRHTPHYFDFGEIKPANTQWPAAWGGGAANQVDAQLVHVLNTLAAAHDWLMPGVAKVGQGVPMGGSAQIAALAVAGGANQINVGQFFPENNPGAGLFPHPDTTMRAIHKVL